MDASRFILVVRAENDGGPPAILRLRRFLKLLLRMAGLKVVTVYAPGDCQQAARHLSECGRWLCGSVEAEAKEAA